MWIETMVTLGLGSLSYSFFLGFQKVLRKGMMKTDKNLNVVTGRVLSSCMLFPGRKYLSELADVHPLIREQFLYCQSSSPCKSFRLNYGYRHLRFLRPRCTYHRYSHMYLSGNQTERRWNRVSQNNPKRRRRVEWESILEEKAGTSIFIHFGSNTPWLAAHPSFRRKPESRDQRTGCQIKSGMTSYNTPLLAAG